jgi:hypothetical protein
MGGAQRRLPAHLRGVRVHLTVQCQDHGSHSATMTGPFLQVIDAVSIFREAATERGRWVIAEYEALDYVPECTVSEWE